VDYSNSYSNSLSSLNKDEPILRSQTILTSKLNFTSSNKLESKAELSKRITQALKQQLEFERNIDETVRDSARLKRLELRKRKELDAKMNPSPQDLLDLEVSRHDVDIVMEATSKSALINIMSNFEVKIVFINQCCASLLAQDKVDEPESKELLLSIMRVIS